MKHQSLRNLIFFALLCDLGLFSKRLISPAANLITDSLHIPGGISTSFSLMFLVIAAMLSQHAGCAFFMSIIQSFLALMFGMTGSMGILAPIGYIIPGLVIDCVILTGNFFRVEKTLVLTAANMISAASASLTANMIVFHLRGPVLLLYVSVSLTSGAVCGFLAGTLTARLRSVIQLDTSPKEVKKI